MIKTSNKSVEVCFNVVGRFDMFKCLFMLSVNSLQTINSSYKAKSKCGAWMNDWQSNVTQRNYKIYIYLHTQMKLKKVYYIY